MLLDNGNLNMRRLLAGHASGKKITQIAVGTSGTAVTAADTALTGSIAKNITAVNYISGTGEVEFVSALEAADPGLTVQEMGLLNEDGVLVHRKVVAPFVRVTGVINTLIYRIKIR